MARAVVSTADATALVGGAALGWISAAVFRRLPERSATVAGGAALITAAVIYPAARREHGQSATERVEHGVVAVAVGVSAVAAAAQPGVARRLLAGAWLAHAAFDGLIGRSHDSRLPAWYPAVCAGYDAGFAGRFWRP